MVMMTIAGCVGRPYTGVANAVPTHAQTMTMSVDHMLDPVTSRQGTRGSGGCQWRRALRLSSAPTPTSVSPIAPSARIDAPVAARVPRSTSTPRMETPSSALGAHEAGTPTPAPAATAHAFSPDPVAEDRRGCDRCGAGGTIEAARAAPSETNDAPDGSVSPSSVLAMATARAESSGDEALMPTCG